MSCPEYIELCLKVAKKKLRFPLGTLVYSANDPRKKPLVIAGFLDDEDDYICKRITPAGKPLQNYFEENELIKIEK